MAIRQFVYVMPFSEQSQEDLSWTLKEIVDGGGDASIYEVCFLEGLTDEQVISLFQTARESDCEKIIQKDLAVRLSGEGSDSSAVHDELAELRGNVWVTRKNLFVDRFACGWLIRCVVDKAAVFKFVDADTYTPKTSEMRFEMFDGEYTHEGDQCTFAHDLWHSQIEYLSNSIDLNRKDRAKPPLRPVSL